MTNQDIINLCNNGVMGITAHDIPAADHYQILLFKRAVDKIRKEITEQTEAISDDPKKEELLNEMAKAEVKLTGFKPISWESFCALAAENRSVPVARMEIATKKVRTVFCDPLGWAEDILEGILWKLPEEAK